jgi:hypothetical protein
MIRASCGVRLGNKLYHGLLIREDCVLFFLQAKDLITPFTGARMLGSFDLHRGMRNAKTML